MSTLARDIHYRLTPSFRDQLGRRADEWGVSQHVAARRLAALANYNLSIDDHSRVVELATTLGVDFVAAATALATFSRQELVQ